MRQARPYQIAPIKRLRALKSALVFVPLRGGKTKIVVDALRRGDRLPRMLVVCPLTVIGVWQSELAAEGITNPVVVVRGTRKQKRVLMKTEGDAVFLTNYECISAMRSHAVFAFADCAAVVLDESTKIKHNYTAIAKAAVGSLRGIPRRFVLTGTPVTESLLDLWQQVDFVAPALFGRSFFEWRETYFTSDHWGTKWQPKPDTREKLFKKVASITVDVPASAVALAPEKDVSVVLELSPEPRRLYDRLRSLFAIVLEGKNWESNYTVAVMEKLSQMCSGFLFFAGQEQRKMRPTGAKMNDALLSSMSSGLREETLKFSDYAKSDWLHAFLCRHRGEKVLIWFRHTFIGRVLSVVLKSERWPYTVLTGETPPHERRRQLRVFASSKFAAQAMQIDTAKHGIQALADHVIFYEPTWSFEAYYQARKRAQQSGRTEPINYYLLQMKDTIEELFYKVLAAKGNLHERFRETLLRGNNTCN